MASHVDLVLKAFVVAARPLVRLLIKKGATFPAASEQLRQLFISEAVAEVRAQGMKPTASAVSLLSGVHRKDLRARDWDGADPSALPAKEGSSAEPPLGLIGEVVGRWMTDARFCSGGQARVLQRGADSHSFDVLVQSVSTDVGPRAVLDEMLRLKVVRLVDDGIELDAHGLVPRGDFAAMSDAMSQNLRDHAAAACANLNDGQNLLEQAIYVDEITPESAEQLHQAATRAWRQAFQRVMTLAEKRFAQDARQEPAERRGARVRFGVYFHKEDRTQEPPNEP